MNITDGNTTYGNLHVPFFWRVSNRTELNNILVDVRGEGVEGGRGGRWEGGRGGRWEGGRGGKEGGREGGRERERGSSPSCAPVHFSAGSEKLQCICKYVFLWLCSV